MSFGTLKYDCMIKTSVMFSFLPLINSSVAIELSFKLSNAFIFYEPEPPIINILYGLPGIYGQFRLGSALFSFVTKLIILYLHLDTTEILFCTLFQCLYHMDMMLFY